MKNKKVWMKVGIGIIGLIIINILLIISLNLVENSKKQYCTMDNNCNVANNEICINNQCVENNFECRNILNKKIIPDKSDIVTCQAEPWLYINPKNNDCVYRGCGYSPYTSPGDGWIRIQ